MSEREKRKKKLGVIGGMGPEATVYFYEGVTAHTVATGDQDHIDMIILSHASMPDRTKAILSGEETDLIRNLEEDARTLERMGVSNIAIPCNTSHHYYEKIQAAVKIPVINMVEESVRAAAKHFTQEKPMKEGIPPQYEGKIGIMATDGTVKCGIYSNMCQSFGIEPIIPSQQRQKDVMSLIYDDVKQGKTGDPEKFKRVIQELKDAGCDAVILACTELSVFKREHQVPEFCLDAMDVLVKESILRSGGEYKKG